jgi:hypothetical protein
MVWLAYARLAWKSRAGRIEKWRSPQPVEEHCVPGRTSRPGLASAFSASAAGVTLLQPARLTAWTSLASRSRVARFQPHERKEDRK